MRTRFSGAWIVRLIGIVSICFLVGCLNYPNSVDPNPADKAYRFPHRSFSSVTKHNAASMYREGQKIFRYDTFGCEVFWGDELRLHEAILGEKQGGVGPGLTPK